MLMWVHDGWTFPVYGVTPWEVLGDIIEAVRCDNTCRRPYVTACGSAANIGKRFTVSSQACGGIPVVEVRAWIKVLTFHRKQCMWLLTQPLIWRTYCFQRSVLVAVTRLGAMLTKVFWRTSTNFLCKSYFSATQMAPMNSCFIHLDPCAASCVSIYPSLFVCVFLC